MVVEWVSLKDGRKKAGLVVDSFLNWEGKVRYTTGTWKDWTGETGTRQVGTDCQMLTVAEELEKW